MKARVAARDAEKRRAGACDRWSKKNGFWERARGARPLKESLPRLNLTLSPSVRSGGGGGSRPPPPEPPPPLLCCWSRAARGAGLGAASRAAVGAPRAIFEPTRARRPPDRGPIQKNRRRHVRDAGPNAPETRGRSRRTRRGKSWTRRRPRPRRSPGPAGRARPSWPPRGRPRPMPTPARRDRTAAGPVSAVDAGTVVGAARRAAGAAERRGAAAAARGLQRRGPVRPSRGRAWAAVTRRASAGLGALTGPKR